MTRKQTFIHSLTHSLTDMWRPAAKIQPPNPDSTLLEMDLRLDDLHTLTDDDDD